MGCLNESYSTATRLRRKEAGLQINQSPSKYSRLQRSSVTFILVTLLVASAVPVVEPTTDIAGKNVETVEKLLVGQYHGANTPTTRFYDFHFVYVNKTANCVTKPLLTANGEFPGPAIYAVEGDRIIVNVTNHANANLTIHWHGVKQILSCWSDGTGYITNCPIQPGDYFIYNFTITGQRGTLFWHAHVNWARASLHGGIFVYPSNFSYPFRKPANEFPVIIQEWWNEDVQQVELQGLLSGGPFKVADALLINGHPGVRYNCSATEGITTFNVSPRKTYLLRIINAVLNTEVFFAVANHTLTVVEVDSEYVKPFQTSYVFIAPGQTTSVLLTTRQLPNGSSFYMAAKSFKSQIGTDYIDYTPAEVKYLELDFPMVATSALLQYTSNTTTIEPRSGINNGNISFPRFPRTADMNAVKKFQRKMKTLTPTLVPQTVDRHLYFTVGISSLINGTNTTCLQNCSYRVSAAVNNITFTLPTIALLQAYYYDIPGVFTTDFPDYPPTPFNYTYPLSPPLKGIITHPGTRLTEIEYGHVVQLVLQDTSFFEFENHPFHLHGYSFFVVGRGAGNYDHVNSPATFNTYDPPSRFTIDVQSGGWVAIRFRATNPGVWLLHCHLDKHVSWGMQMAFLVKNGVGVNETLPPPPRLNQC
ncbi:unnamed protein product [Calypogeia fissa]